jgi:hypothetical protein
MEKERARGREKYHRLGYKDRDWANKTRRDFCGIDNVSRSLKVRGYDTSGKEAHHWNYNKPRSVILLSPLAHHRIHQYIKASRSDKYIYTLDGECLDTEEKTISYYKKVLSQYADLNENLEIINF